MCEVDRILVDIFHHPGQITKTPQPEISGFWENSLTKPPFGVTSAEVLTIVSENESTKEKMLHGLATSVVAFLEHTNFETKQCEQ